MSKKIIIASDSTTDLSPELIERYGIKILPLKLTLGEDVYSDGVDIDADKIYDFNKKTGLLPKTTASNIGEYTDFFTELTKDGDSVIMFSLSGEMSSTLNNARVAASDFENVFVVDTRNLSTGGGLLVLAACDMVKEGLSAEEIVKNCEKLAPNVDASFVLDNLEYIYKGGRCSAVSVLGANLLKLKPLIEVKNGVMGVGKKYRGKYGDVLKEYVNERIADIESIDKTRVFITHSGVDEEICRSIIDIVKEKNYFDEVLFTRAGCTISSHCGPNTLGILFVRKSPIA